MKHLKFYPALAFSCLFLLYGQITAQEGYVPSQENMENREWFQDAKYGLFVQRGVYSIYKTVKTLIRTMVRAAGFGGNFLLNTGPMPNGKIQPENVDTLMAIGRWLETHGESIYGTRGGPLRPQEWGAMTRKGNTIYVHILDHPGGELEIKGFGPKIRSAIFFDDGSKVDVKKKKRVSSWTSPRQRSGPSIPSSG